MAPHNGLTSVLNWPSRPSTAQLPQAGTQTLVTDTIGSPATFLLVHFLRCALLESHSSRRVTWVSCDSSGYNHVASICRRIGVNLNQMKSKGLFQWIDASGMLVEADGDPLKKLYARCKASLQNSQGSCLDSKEPSSVLIVDDVTSIAWSLVQAEEEAARAVGRWTVALRQLCHQNNTSLITLLHTANLSDSLTQTLFTRLYRSSSLWIQVKELSSGKARDCSGELSVHVVTQDTASMPITPALGRSKAMLFNIGNDGVSTVWARGTQQV